MCFSARFCWALFAFYGIVVLEKQTRLNNPKEYKMAQKRIAIPKDYNYEWKTAEEIINNMNTEVNFPTFGTGTLAKITGVTDENTYRKAHELWLKLKEEFNAEAKTYVPTAYNSKLGSVGDTKRREVLRACWWDALSNQDEEDYYDITSIIEVLHDHETLETGKILFGS